MLAITRATEICIASAGLVLAGTGFCGARHRLAAQLAGGRAQEIARHFLNSFSLAESSEAEVRTIRRALNQHATALYVTIDEVMGGIVGFTPAFASCWRCRGSRARVPGGCMWIRLDHVPPGLQLVAGISATGEVDPWRTVNTPVATRQAAAWSFAE